MPDALLPIGAGLATLVAGLVVLHIARLVLRRAARRTPVAAVVSRRARRPAHVAALLAAAHVTLAGLPAADWHDAARHVLTLGDIAVLTWVAGTVVMIIIDLAVARHRTDVRDNWRARRVHTQANVIRRVGIAGLSIVAVGAMLLTFPAFRAAGASLLASAGIAGVIAGFAAQSLLGNVIAGAQLVFSEALSLDDVVVVEGEWGRVEEITLTYVVVRIWDERRLILPTSYFMTTPFENWTRSQAAVLGTVEIDLDWTVPVGAMRAELERAVKENERWDGRVCVLQVTDAVEGRIRVRALVSASDAPTLWDLRCDVRERLVRWVHGDHPDARPRLRAEISEASAASGASADGAASGVSRVSADGAGSGVSAASAAAKTPDARGAQALTAE
jgi:small-conductance mechanosensitive channel